MKLKAAGSRPNWRMKVPSKLWKTNLKVQLSLTTWNLKEAEKGDFPEICRRNWSIHCFLHIGALCYVLNTVPRVGGLTLWLSLLRSMCMSRICSNTLSTEGGHAAISAICSRHEPVLEIRGKPTDVGGKLLIRYVVFKIIAMWNTWTTYSYSTLLFFTGNVMK